MRIVILRLSSQMANLLVVVEFLTSFKGTLQAIKRTNAKQHLSLVLSFPLKEKKSCFSGHFLDDTLL